MRTSTLAFLLLAIGCDTVAMAAPFNFDCRAATDRSSEVWRMRPQAPPFHVRGLIRPMQLEPLPTYPLERDGMIIESSDDGRGADVTLDEFNESTGINLVVRPGEAPDAIMVGVVTTMNERDTMRLIIERGLAWRAGDPLEISFEISVLASGRAMLRIGTREIPLDVTFGADSRVGVRCSGGHFQIRDLEMDS